MGWNFPKVVIFKDFSCDNALTWLIISNIFQFSPFIITKESLENGFIHNFGDKFFQFCWIRESRLWDKKWSKLSRSLSRLEFLFYTEWWLEAGGIVWIIFIFIFVIISGIICNNFCCIDATFGRYEIKTFFDSWYSERRTLRQSNSQKRKIIKKIVNKLAKISIF